MFRSPDELAYLSSDRLSVFEGSGSFMVITAIIKKLIVHCCLGLLKSLSAVGEDLDER